MAKSKLPKLVIFGDLKKKRVAEVITEFEDFAKTKAEIIANCTTKGCTNDVFKEADFAVVFGGDGAILSAARNLSGTDIPVIGINIGKLGFLAEFSVGDIRETFDKIVAGQMRIEKRMMLQSTVCTGDKEKFSSIAINDVFVTAGPPFRMVELKIYVDGQPLAGCVSDGLVVSTPTGSTAYNLSAGGPILSGKLSAMVITPVCPHSLSFRPIVINSESIVEIAGTRLNKGTTVSIDGQISQSFLVGDVVKIQKHKGDFLVVNNPSRSQWDTLATKLNWAEKLKYRKN